MLNQVISLCNHFTWDLLLLSREVERTTEMGGRHGKATTTPLPPTSITPQQTTTHHHHQPPPLSLTTTTTTIIILTTTKSMIPSLLSSLTFSSPKFIFQIYAHLHAIQKSKFHISMASSHLRLSANSLQ